MAKNSDKLLSFLFGESAELEAQESDADVLKLAENLEKLFEAVAEEEKTELKAKKTPLTKALSEFGISDADLEMDTDGFILATDNHQKYVDALTVLGSAEAMHRLAEMGWVVTRPGDNAMTNEPANYRIRFLEITTAEENNREPKAGTYDTANREEVIRKAQEFASTPMDRDDELNPVETDIKGSDQDRKGIGKEQDGKQPEGTPKGTAGKPKVNNVQDSLDEAFFMGGKWEKGHEQYCPKCKAVAVATGTSNGQIRLSCPKCGYKWQVKSGSTKDESLEEMTTTGSMGSLEAPISMHQPFKGPGIRTKGSGGSLGGKFKMPGQWKVKQPVVNKQAKRKVKSEAIEQAAQNFLKEEDGLEDGSEEED